MEMSLPKLINKFANTNVVLRKISWSLENYQSLGLLFDFSNQKFDMKFKVVMGYIYLFIFIGVFAWKLWATLGHKEDGPLMVVLVVIVISFITLKVRKMIFENK